MDPLTARMCDVLDSDPRTRAHLAEGVGEVVALNPHDVRCPAELAALLGEPVRVRHTSRRAVAEFAQSTGAEADSADDHVQVASEYVPLANFLSPWTGATPRLVVFPLPKSLRELDHLSRHIAAAGPAVVVAAGRVKHMTPAMNEVLAASFEHVHATLAKQKTRCLVAAGSKPVELPHPASRAVMAAGTELTLVGEGGVFNAAKPDHGGLLLLATLARHPLNPARIHDLGCGNGLLTAWLATRFPDAVIHASDDSSDAVASTKMSLARSSIDENRVAVTWQASMSDEPDDSYDLIVLNPPFHRGSAVDPTLAFDLIDAAVRCLRPGGELWVVHNSHLRYRSHLARHGRVDQMARDPRFTVVRMTYDRST